MKRRIRLILAATMVMSSLLAGCGSTAQNTSNTNATEIDAQVNESQPKKTLRVFSNRTESHVAYQILMDIAKQYQNEVNPNFNIEIETEPNLDDYKNKLKLYIAGNELPDYFQIDKGPIAEELSAAGKLMDMDEELAKAGMTDKLNLSCRKYNENLDGSLYIMPEARYGNTFFYWKDQFENAGVTDTPKTFTEFIDVCQKLKNAGYIPIAATAKASWNPLHIMYLPSWSVTGNDWLDSAKKGEVKFSDIPVVVDSAKFLDTLATNGYFPAGFGNIEYTDIMNGFLEGDYSMAWCQSVYLNKFADAYAEGKLGFMLIPTNNNDSSYEQVGTIAVQTGISWALNAETYDAETERFYKYLLTHYTETCYKFDTYSPFDDLDLPDGKSQIMKDYFAEMQKQTICWSNWDDNCDPVTGSLMDDLVKQLAAGMISPEDFLSQLDESAATEGKEYFGSN